MYERFYLCIRTLSLDRGMSGKGTKLDDGFVCLPIVLTGAKVKKKEKREKKGNKHENSYNPKVFELVYYNLSVFDYSLAYMPYTSLHICTLNPSLLT